MIRYLVATVLLLLAASASAQQLAFPTAEGYGRFAQGGRGGYVCYVNTLSGGTSGAQYGGGPHHTGSFRYCLSQSGARNILFSVAGIIPVGGVQHAVSNGNFTIAGQTAPGDGILVQRLWLSIRAPHTIVRYLRIRNDENLGASRAIEHAFGASNGIIDHGSYSWTRDDITAIWNNVSNVTWQWNIIAEGLDQPDYPRPMIIGSSGTDNASVLYNLLSNHKDRLPEISNGGVQLVNNVIYNGDGFTNLFPKVSGQGIQVDAIGNMYLPGPTTDPDRPRLRSGTGPNDPYWDPSLIYLEGNIHPLVRPNNGFPEDAILLKMGGFTPPMSGTRIHPAPATETDAFEAKDRVLANAGARIPAPDQVDINQINDVLNGTGDGTILTVAEAGGFPTYGGTPRDLDTYDTDRDGIPNTWETACSSVVNTASTNHTGLSNSVNTDAALIVSSTGYSALEHYLNEIAGDYEAGSCGGLSGTSSDTTPPTNVAITAPTNGATVSGASVNICSTADDETGVVKVDFFVAGALVGTDTTETADEFCIAWNSTSVNDGIKSVHSVAYDLVNSTPSAAINVTVDNVSGYTAIHAATPPTIDGNLIEFANTNLISVVGPSQSAGIRLMWDSTNLYLAMFTSDTDLVAPKTTHDQSTLYEDDSLEIAIDPDKSGGAWTANDYRMIITARGTTLDAHTLTNTAGWEPTYSLFVDRSGTLDDGANDTFWEIEMALPWSEIGLTPIDNDVIGLNFQMNDKDGAVRTPYNWNGDVNVLNNAVDITLGPSSGGDTTDPTNVAITAPADGAFIGGTYPIQATADDASGSVTVQFFEGVNLLCTVSAPPFICNWDTTLETEGVYSLTIEACDAANNCVTSSPAVSVTIDNTAPSTPTNLILIAEYQNGPTITADWDDAAGASHYRIERCEGDACSAFVEVDTSLTSDFSDLVELVENTTYCYRVRAYDLALNPSGYSGTECVQTLSVVATFPPAPSLPTDTASATIVFPPAPVSPTDTASPNPEFPPAPVSPTDTASPSTVFPPSPGVPTSP